MNATTLAGNTPYLLSRCVEVAQTLLNAGADPKVKNFSGQVRPYCFTIFLVSMKLTHSLNCI